MQPTARALDRLLRAVGDPIAEIRDIVAGRSEFVEATVLRAAAGVLAKTPDALMWRLAHDGVEDQGLWRRISDAFECVSMPGFWSYVDLHAGLAHFGSTFSGVFGPRLFAANAPNSARCL